MRTKILARLLPPAALVLALGLPRTAGAVSIYDVIMLSRSGYEAEEIVEIIRSTGTAFRLTANDAVYLKNVGVSDAVVEAMLTAVPQEAPQAESGAQRPAEAEPLTVTIEDLLLLSASGVSDEIIIAFIETRELAFSPGANEIVTLRNAGLSDNVIQHLLTRSAGVEEEVIGDYYQQEPPVAFYPPQRYFYGPSYFIGFGGLHHPLFEHHFVHFDPFFNRHLFPSHRFIFVPFDPLPGKGRHVGPFHDESGHGFGLHRGTKHHVGTHRVGEEVHDGLHHITRQHVEEFHQQPRARINTTPVRVSDSIGSTSRAGNVGTTITRRASPSVTGSRSSGSTRTSTTVGRSSGSTTTSTTTGSISSIRSSPSTSTSRSPSTTTGSGFRSSLSSLSTDSGAISIGSGSRRSSESSSGSIGTRDSRSSMGRLRPR